MGLRRSLCLVLWIAAVTAGEHQNSTDVKQSDRRGKVLKISRKPCTDPGGKTGVCTFKWDCINGNGTLMGTCADGFIFGTCCRFEHAPTRDGPYADNTVLLSATGTTTSTTTPAPPSSTTENATTSPTDTRRPVQIVTLKGTRRPPVALTTVRPPTTATATSGGGQLVTWTSIGPTRPPQRPIILQPFPFRPGSGMPAGWPVGVAFPVDPFQINRPLQVFRPPVLLQSAPGTIVSHAPEKPAPQSGGNGSYTILHDDGPEKTTVSNQVAPETTTISVPIPQWSTEASAPWSSAAQSTSSSSSTGRPLKHTLDYRKDCGVRAIGARARIVGGQSATFGRWPWQVLVKEAAWLGLYQKNKCGGVLVSSKHAITAGHCQPGRFLSALVVILGEYDLLSDLERLKPEVRRVRRMIVHRDYNPQNFDNDIAVLELDPPVLFRPHISPVCLPAPDEDFTGRVAYVTGWGKTTHGGAIPNLLQEVQVPIMSNSECVNMFKEAGHAKLIKDSFLCAGYKTGGKDSCEGDSGGPLMVERESGQWVLVGTVSHGIRCADPNLPGVYMKISAYRSWIDKIIQ